MRTFRDFNSRAEAETFKASLPAGSKARITVRRSTIGLGKRKRPVTSFAVNYNEEN